MFVEHCCFFVFLISCAFVFLRECRAHRWITAFASSSPRNNKIVFKKKTKKKQGNIFLYTRSDMWGMMLRLGWPYLSRTSFPLWKIYSKNLSTLVVTVPVLLSFSFEWERQKKYSPFIKQKREKKNELNQKTEVCYFVKRIVRISFGAASDTDTCFNPDWLAQTNELTRYWNYQVKHTQ